VLDPDPLQSPRKVAAFGHAQAPDQGWAADTVRRGDVLHHGRGPRSGAGIPQVRQIPAPFGAVAEVRGTVIRENGKGLRIKPKPKRKSGYRTLELPTWEVESLRRRKPADARPDDPVFTAPMGGLRDPSNTNADLRGAFDKAGYPWVTSHVYRKTVASLMDEAGLSARAAADQLGHAQVSMTQNVYMKRKVVKTGAAGVLEPVGSTE
jgi:integrase-like protein